MIYILVFKAEWCGACQQFKNSGVWTELMKLYKDNPKVKLRVLDEDLDASTFKMFNIDAYPTIVSWNSETEQVQRFTGARTLDNLQIFIAEQVLDASFSAKKK